MKTKTIKQKNTTYANKQKALYITEIACGVICFGTIVSYFIFSTLAVFAVIPIPVYIGMMCNKWRDKNEAKMNEGI